MSAGSSQILRILLPWLLFSLAREFPQGANELKDTQLPVHRSVSVGGLPKVPQVRRMQWYCQDQPLSCIDYWLSLLASL